MYREMRDKHKEDHRNRLYVILGFTMLACSLIFAGLAIYETAELRKEQKVFEQLANINSTYECDSIEPLTDNLSDAAGNEAVSLPVSEPEILPQYMELAQRNSDLFGWIKINDTILDYPVMHTPEDPEKYLRSNFNGNPSIAGTIFLDYRCSENSDNLILYGHNMKNKTMFGSILHYKDESYWREHPVIQFDTVYEHREYEVLAAFFDHVYDKNDACFKYYDFIEAADEDAFNEAIHSYQEKALYDTSVSVQYGNQFLTLSTCAYHTENGRFVVVARRCPDAPQNK